MGDDRRTADRWPYLHLVGFRCKSIRGEGRLANVSESGVFVRTDRLPAPGERVHLTLQGCAPPIELQGQVCWIGRRQDGAEGFGAKLSDPPRAYLDLVESLSLTRCVEGPQRVAPRLALSLPVAVEFGSACDEGMLCDISTTGARLEKTGVCPTVGSQVTLLFSIQGYRRAFELVARVVRVTEAPGYAVQFESIDPDLQDALDHAAAFSEVSHPDTAAAE